MFLEGLWIIKYAGPDDQPKISVFGKSPFKKIVGPAPVSPVLRGTGKSIYFENELAEEWRRDIERCLESIRDEGGHLSEGHAES